MFSLSACAAQSNNIKKLYDEVNDSVVELHVKMLAEPNPKETIYKKATMGSLGSGVVINRQGRILTAAHVVDKAVSIEVEFANGEKTTGHVVWVESAVDLAMIQAAEVPEGVKVASLAKAGEYGVGEQVAAIGAPYGVSHSLSVGYLSGIRDQEHLSKIGYTPRFLQTDAAINKGNSGGPLFNLDGQVIGIVSQILSKSGGSEGLGFVVSVDTVHDVIEQGPAMFSGFTVYALSEKEAHAMNIKEGYGMLVQHVIPKSLAEKLGFVGGDMIVRIGERRFLVGGDIILAIGGIEPNTFENVLKLKDYIANLESGEIVEFRYIRKGEYKTLDWEVE